MISAFFLPIVLIALLTLPILASAINKAIALLRKRVPLPGHCVACGYDLAGNTSGVCPECGQYVASRTPTPAEGSGDPLRPAPEPPGESRRRVWFARFTDRARKVMSLANQEAKRRSQDGIGPEHLLAGLLLEGTGVGVAALRNLGVDPRTALDRLGEHLTVGPQMIIVGKLPQIPAARRVIRYAIQESSSLGHKHVGTEHVLLGLLRDPGGVPARVLAGFGVDFPKARAEVARMMGAFCSCGYPVGDFSVCPECGKPVIPVPEGPA